MSSTRFRDALDVDVITRALEVLRSEGYEVVSLSGGEPFIFPGLNEVVAESHRLGYRVNVVTNGLSLTERRLAPIADKLNLVAVSFDGAPAAHNRLRGRPDCFARAEAAMDLLAGMGLTTAVAFCVSRESLPEVPWVYDFTVEKRAKVLNLHPLVLTGRAESTCSDIALSESDRARLFLVVTLLEDGASCGPDIQLDLIPVQSLEGARGEYARLADERTSPALLSDLVNPLIITERGRLVPFAYGLNPLYEIARLDGDWVAGLDTFREQGRQRLASIVFRAFDEIRQSGTQYVEWYENLVAASYRSEPSSDWAPSNSLNI